MAWDTSRSKRRLEVRALGVLLYMAGNHDDEANARLVSSAPDLLAACRLAVSFTQDEWGDGHVAMRALRAAIAKAEGGQP